MKILLACLLAAMLTACGTSYKFSVDQTTLTMPEAVRQKCDQIPKELQRGASMGNQTAAYNNLIGLYGECAQRDAAKADWISSQNQ